MRNVSGPRLADLEEVPVGVAEEAPDLPVVLDRRRQELGAPGSESLVGRPAIGHAEDHLDRDNVGVRRRGEGDGRFVGSRLAAGDEQEPLAEQLHDN